MDKYLFIVRSPSELEICSKELPVDTNLFSMAYRCPFQECRMEYGHCKGIGHHRKLSGSLQKRGRFLALPRSLR